ncbi:hypothetical protein PLICRDRAFT_502258 [Plicaturopsis crispa FD-325 SS-3]|nr:hypothetical protein PLICRDRAFT_502258 [Plicaturopsis crispa FD-325 SS-3]
MADLTLFQQDRRDVPNHPRPSTEFPPPPAGPHLKLSGTNSIPVGNRKYPTPPASQGPRPVLEPRRSFSSANAEPIRGPPPRSNPSMKESYDRPPQYNSRVVSPVEAFRPPRDADWRAPSASYEQHFERRAPLPPSPPMDLPSSLPPRPRGNSYRGSSSSARYAPMGHRESRSASPPRIWTPRKTSLSPPPRAAYPAEARYRDPTPPPPSADPSPRWEPSSYVAQNPPRDPERDHREHSRFNGSHHHNSMSPVRRKHEVNPMRPIDEDRRAASMSLEGRLSENYDDRFVEGPHRMQAPSMARRRTPELYREPLPMRQDYGRPDDVGERRSWNRSNEPEDSQRSSKPVRIKRGPPMSTSGPTEDDGRRPEPVGLRSEGRSRSAQDMPPALQMGDHRVESRNSASLLERLSTRDGGSPGPPSLRDRVQVPTKRSREDMVEDPLGSMDVAYDGDEGLDGGAPRAKRRNPKTKPKRGRRVGAAS